MTRCIGEPISWLRLERFALGEADPAIRLHTAACPACRRCLEQICGDVVTLRPLELRAEFAPAQSWLARYWRRAQIWWRAQRARRRWPALALAAALAAIAVLAVVVMIAPDDSTRSERNQVAVGAVLRNVLPSENPERVVTALGSDDSLGVVAVKGVGEVRLELVRERAGEVRFDARSFARGDRWKVIVTCATSATVWVEVSVSDGATIDRPIAPAQLICGNRVVLPGAFTITGLGANRVCAHVASGPGAPTATTCAMVHPE